MKTHNIIIRTLITEKSSRHQEGKKYTFEVGKDATKTILKKEIENLYGVKVAKISIMIAPKKKRTLGKGRIWTKRDITKKAIITLKDKKSIDPNKIKELKKKL